MISPNQMILFGMEFMQMMEDFSTEHHCPACRKETRDGLICLNDECDFVLFIDLGDRIHPAYFKWVSEETEKQRSKN